MIEGACHCGKTGWTLDTAPKTVTACNCTICRRYGALWAYGYLGEDIKTTGQTSAYLRFNSGDGGILFKFCTNCGCVTHFLSADTDANGRTRIAVNFRMSDPTLVSDVLIRHFDGHENFVELPPDGKVVKDLWS